MDIRFLKISQSYLVIMQMIVFTKKDSTVNVSKDFFRKPFLAFRIVS